MNRRQKLRKLGHVDHCYTNPPDWLYWWYYDNHIRTPKGGKRVRHWEDKEQQGNG